MTQEFAPPRRRRPSPLRVLSGGRESAKTPKKEKPKPFWNPPPELELLGPFDYLPTMPGCIEVTGPEPDEAFYMSEPDFGREEDPEAAAAHAAWLKEYCAKNRRRDA